MRPPGGDGLEQDVALTPRHSSGIVGMWEREDAGRIGVELYLTESFTFRVLEPAAALGIRREGR